MDEGLVDIVENLLKNFDSLKSTQLAELDSIMLANSKVISTFE